MPDASHFLAVDLGASGGRAMLGEFDGTRLTMEELHRFTNGPVEIAGHLHWDTMRLFDGVKTGLRRCAERNIRLDGVGIDTWGVDYGLLDDAGQLVNAPCHYRDLRTRGVMDRVLRKVSRADIYSRTGIQFMPINTLYQLASEDAAVMNRARMLLFMPDLLNYWLTGVKTSEQSIASTSQLYDTIRCEWAGELLEQIGITPSLCPPVGEPGLVVGPLLPAICSETGLAPTPVIAPAGHDTACAVAAVPALDTNWAYISSGTWSLVGLELPAPVRTPAALRANLTNEAGVAGTTRLLRNVTGLWLMQECRRVWAEQGEPASHAELASLAERSAALRSLIDPDDTRFAEPCDMPQRIREWCRETRQPEPESAGAITRCVIESLALKTQIVLEILEPVAGVDIHCIHMVGGGVQNDALCQFTANASGRRVLAGPSECTAIGNIMLQAMALGRVASLTQMREMIARSYPPRAYEPRDREAWQAALDRFRTLVG